MVVETAEAHPNAPPGSPPTTIAVSRRIASGLRSRGTADEERAAADVEVLTVSCSARCTACGVVAA
jgi:hypothetical protein